MLSGLGDSPAGEGPRRRSRRPCLPSVTGLEPEALGVHPSIVVDGVGGLTPYLLRPHDSHVREALSKVLEPDARPLMLIVAGDSCTGKTRCLYEAVKAVLPTWPVIRPARYTDQLRHELGAGITDGSVLWLDELKDYLDVTEAGQETAKRLLRLLDQRGPVAVVATSWHAALAALSRPSTPEENRVGRGAVPLLLETTRPFWFSVPAQFTDAQLGEVDGTDARMQAAVASARDGQVTQLLGGGTLLLDNYLDTRAAGFSPEAVAIITAAMELGWTILPEAAAAELVASFGIWAYLTTCDVIALANSMSGKLMIPAQFAGADGHAVTA
jgi:hypothetical protein